MNKSKSAKFDIDSEIHDAFHYLWSDATENIGYNKLLWKSVEHRIKNGESGINLLADIHRLSMIYFGNGGVQKIDPRFDKAWETLRDHLS